MQLIRRWVDRALPFERVGAHTIYTRAMPAAPCLLDIGANRGAFTRTFCERFGGRAVLVEPNPAFAGHLAETLSFPTLPYAIAMADGPVIFNIAKNDEGSSLLLLPTESAYNCILDHSETVTGRTLDSLLAEIGEARVDVMKLDAEGIELMLLPQLTADAAQRVAQISVEFHCDPVFGFGRREMAEAARRRLRALGFVAIDFSAGQVVWEDVLFVNRRHHRISTVGWWYWKSLVRLKSFYRFGRRVVQRVLSPLGVKRADRAPPATHPRKG